MTQCPRCLKFTAEIHTCSPSPALMKLQAELECLREQAARDYSEPAMQETMSAAVELTLLRAVAEAAEELLERVDTVGLGPYVGGPPFAVKHTRDALTKWKEHK